MNSFFNIDFESIFPTPTPQRFSEAFFNRLWRKLHVDNFSLLISFYGKHRVGKSLSAVSFAYILDPTFEKNLEKRVVYDSKALTSSVKEVRQKRIRGAAFIVDEAGSGDLSSQRWYEEAAKIVSAELQAVGYLNPFIGFVTQSFSFINTTARKLSQGVFEVERTNNFYSTIRPYWITTTPWFSNILRRYPIFCEGIDGVPSNVYKMNKIKISMPPKDIVERYTIHSQEFKDKLLESSERDIDAIAIQKERDYLYVSGIDTVVKQVMEKLDYYKLKKKTKPGVDEDLIRYDFNLKQYDAKLVKKLVEKKLEEMEKNKKGKASKENSK